MMNHTERCRAAVAELVSAIAHAEHVESVLESMGLEDSAEMRAANELVGVAAREVWVARQLAGEDAPSLDEMIASIEDGERSQAARVSAGSLPWRR